VWSRRYGENGDRSAGVFFATCARLIGPEVKLTIEQQTMASVCRSHILNAASDRGVPDDQ
jgi:hypothetical protein